MRVRRTARTLVIDDQRRVLLFHIDDQRKIHPNLPEMVIYWLTPGGGIEPDERVEQAALRELWEETGIQVAAVGPCVWHYQRVLHFSAEPVQLDEHFFLVHVPACEVSMANMLPYEQQTHRAFRWWTLDELAQSADAFLPPDLPRLLPPLLDGQIPTTPIELPAN